MLRARSSQLSFYGNHIYDRVISKNHFLKLLDKAVDFSFVNELCRDAYTPDFGRPANEPEKMFKILFLQFLYDISDLPSIIDSTHVKAKVDTFKMKDNPDIASDKDARYGYKSRKKPFFGYKAHASMDSDSELITKLETTAGNAHMMVRNFPRW